MKKFWKALGIAALAAAVPVRVKKDTETGKKKFQSLLLSVDVGPGENGEGTDVGINFGEGIVTGAITNLVDAKKEANLFADDEPEAAVLGADELQVITDEAQEAADQAQTITDEVQEVADEAQAIADEVQEVADEAKAIADEAQEAADEAQSVAGEVQEIIEASEFDPEI